MTARSFSEDVQFTIPGVIGCKSSEHVGLHPPKHGCQSENREVEDSESGNHPFRDSIVSAVQGFQLSQMLTGDWYVGILGQLH